MDIECPSHEVINEPSLAAILFGFSNSNFSLYEKKIEGIV